MFVVDLLFFLLSIMGTVNIACSIPTLILCMSGTSVIFICIYCLSWLKLFLSSMSWDVFVFAVTCHSYHSAHMRLKGNSSQKSKDFLLNPFCINE